MREIKRDRLRENLQPWERVLTYSTNVFIVKREKLFGKNRNVLKSLHRKGMQRRKWKRKKGNDKNYISSHLISDNLYALLLCNFNA